MTEHNTIEQATQVAVAGSPSSNYEVTLNLLGSTTREPLVGNMLFLTHPSNDGIELGLGMVTTVTTENQWHSNNAMLGMVKNHGGIPGMSGDAGDIRRATIKIQAAYRNPKADGTGKWAQSGPTMRMSPPTGVAIRRADASIFDSLIEGEEGIHYLGTMHGSNVRVPLNMRDFAGKRGAYHTGIFGLTGSGKSTFAGLWLMGQMRHRNQGLIVVDPQGQWSHESDFHYSVQGFAAELGREVMVHRIAEDLQLSKDAPLFGELLAKTKFTTNIMKMSAEVQELFIDELVKALKSVDDWETLNPSDLLNALLRKLRKPNVLRLIYADNTKKIRLMVALSELLGEEPEETIEGDFIEDVSQPEYRDYRLTDDGEERRKSALSVFHPLHNLFAPTNPSGTKRHSLWGTISKVFDQASRGNSPAPVLILDMSSSSDTNWTAGLLADEDEAEAQEAIKVLDNDAIKAAILSQVFSTLKRASESAYRNGDNLNTNILLDEAWRFACPPSQATEPEIKELSVSLASYCRDTRKFGIGWTFITQTTRSINPDIWDQLSIRMIGYGLAGADVERVAEQLDDRDHLQLYKGFASPESTGEYPWMLLGPVSPLSSGKYPTFLSTYTNFEDFRHHNREWIEQIRLSMGLSTLVGDPVRPQQHGRLSEQTRAKLSSRVLAGPPKGAAAARQIERVRANRENGGVDPSAAVGLTSDPTFGSALDLLGEGEPPF